jgi:hypothetical protein
MKMQANKNRTERSFPVGTWVYVKLQPYVQTTNAARANQKLSYRFFGPYLIIEKVGSVAYKLQLPSTSAIYLVFHVSQLKAAIPVTHTADQLQNTIDGLQVPQQVLQKRVASSGSEVRLQALIQWSGLPARLATWEDVEALRQRFPEHQLGGKLDLNKGGMSAVLERPLKKPALTMSRTAALQKMGREEARGNAGPMNASKAQIGCEPSRPQVPCRSSI